MRRSIHSLIVTVLCLTLGVDTAKACWFLRHHRRGHVCRPTACPPTCPTSCSEPVVIVSDQPLVEQQCHATEMVVVHGTTQVLDIRPTPPPPAAEPVVPLPGVDEQAAAPAAQPMPREATTLPSAAQEPLPVLQPAIAPVSAEQPVADAASAPAKPTEPAAPATPTPPSADAIVIPSPAAPAAAAPVPAIVDVQSLAVQPKEVNLFDLYDNEAELPADDAEPVDASEPEMAEEDAKPAELTEPDDDNATEPAEKPAPEPEAPAAEADPAAVAVVPPREPLRLWTNATGSDQAQGWLVEIRADRVRILKMTGRHTTVSLDALSAADRDYVSGVAAQQAAQQGTAPATTATAGL